MVSHDLKNFFHIKITSYLLHYYYFLEILLLWFLFACSLKCCLIEIVLISSVKKFTIFCGFVALR